VICNNDVLLNQESKFIKKIFDNIRENLDSIDRELIVVLMWKLTSLFEDTSSLDDKNQDLKQTSV